MLPGKYPHVPDIVDVTGAIAHGMRSVTLISIPLSFDTR